MTPPPTTRAPRRAGAAVVLLALAACPVVGVVDDDDAGPGGAGEGEGEGEGEGDVVGEGEGEGEVFDFALRQERSLVWTDPAVVDDPAVVGAGRVFGAAAAHLGVAPGTLLHDWLVRFSTTAHSERAGPARLAQQLEDTLGPDPTTWVVDDAPFVVTGVHNRIDLLSRDDHHCGELRVSLASTDPILRPFHALFLFRQPAEDGDVDDDGAVTCAATARRWARLSALDGAEFVDAARAALDEGLVADRFLMVESVELTISPWEWRQWRPEGDHLENPPLFQQVDTGMGADRRAEFAAFVDDNADALDDRRLLIPERFRAPSTRVAQGVPWTPLDLSAVSSTTLAAHPRLRQHLEIVGCAACHTADAEFVQTREDRSFSPFYTKELLARRALLDDLVDGVVVAPPFGPLQPDPRLPP
jgi:hypothetical protein